jgi:hypothetical protein
MKSQKTSIAEALLGDKIAEGDYDARVAEIKTRVAEVLTSSSLFVLVLARSKRDLNVSSAASIEPTTSLLALSYFDCHSNSTRWSPRHTC